MGSITDKANYLKETKRQIKTAIQDKGVEVSDTDTFRSYAAKINAIQATGGGDTLPIGSMVPYGNVNPPTGWLVCDGSAISRTTYADLFKVIGTSYGAGDGSTTFNLPNLKGRVPVGLDSSDTDFNTIGKIGGEKTHTLTIQEIPAHNHLLGLSGGGTETNAGLNYQQSSTWRYYDGNDISGFAGGDQPHNNLQPYEVDCWIIKASRSTGIVANVVKVQTESDADVYSCNYINSLRPSIITAGLESDLEITGSTTLQLNRILSSTGNKFTLQNGGIKIGAGVSKIKVSGCLLEEVNDIGLYGCYIYKNEALLANAINVGFNYIPIANQMFKTTCQPVLVDVQEGDIIYLNAYVNQSNLTAKIEAYNGRTANITIEEVLE